jgi:hypothetical protein
MSNDADFLARWSRRKHDAATDKIKPSKPDSMPGDIVSETSAASLAPDENKQPFDATSLPTIESIGAGSDIRAFLETGVPDDLARAALRRVWSLDHTIILSVCRKTPGTSTHLARCLASDQSGGRRRPGGF